MALLTLVPCQTAHAAPSYTGQTCHGGATATATTATCSATITVSLNDIVVCVATAGGATVDISTLTSSAGTGTVTGHVVAGMHGFDSGNTQNFSGGWLQVTGAGTITPRATWVATHAFNGVLCGDFSGVSTTVDGSNATFWNPYTTTANNSTSGSTTSATGDLLAGGGDNNTNTTDIFTAGTSPVTFTKIASASDSGALITLEWGIASGANQNVAYTSSSATDLGIVNGIAMKASGGAAAVPFLMMQGVG